MKKNIEVTKLTLSRESLRRLNDTKALLDVVGGVPEPTQPPGC